MELPETERLEKPNPEASAMPGRRRFSAEYKLKILREASKCTQPGEVKALLKREGLYSSYLTAWRRQQEEGALAPPTVDDNPSSTTHSSPAANQVLMEENRRLQRANEDLQTRLRQAQVVIEVQKKVAEIVSSLLKTIEAEEVDAG